MKKTSLAIIIYIIGIAFGALFLGLWDKETGPIALVGLFWTTLFIIALFYAEKYDSK
tara:strand:- start:297 stop:467 length:171 start_codon:yes stop_codon:yes gene_type:complete